MVVCSPVAICDINPCKVLKMKSYLIAFGTFGVHADDNLYWAGMPKARPTVYVIRAETEIEAIQKITPSEFEPVEFDFNSLFVSRHLKTTPKSYPSFGVFIKEVTDFEVIQCFKLDGGHLDICSFFGNFQCFRYKKSKVLPITKPH
jgi:hypothetical protein